MRRESKIKPITKVLATNSTTTINRLFDWLLPSICPLCLGRAENEGLCVSCQRALPKLPSHCQICATPLPQNALLCGACISKKPFFNRVYAAFPYTAPINRLICGIKYAGYHSDIRPLTLFAIERFKHRKLIAPDCFIPVPLHPTRLRTRGFNQALEIARFFARHFNTPLDWHCIGKPDNRQPQTALHARARQQNARGAYTLHHVPCANRVVIVDDVITTGATANEIARLLRSAGIRHIEVWVLARTGEWPC